MICVTGASGTVGSEVVKQLGTAHAPFRAGYFSRRTAEAAHTRGIDAVVIDYNRPETLRAAFQGCDKLFLLGPTLPNQTQLELNAVEAAKQGGIPHIVKQSVMAAHEERYTIARVHRAVERRIESSGMAWTFLRPNSFMQNAVTFMGGTIRAESVFYSSSGDARISHVDVRDIAAVAVRALTGTNHEGQAYTLTGPQALTYDELAGELSKALGRTIRHINLPPEDIKAGMLAQGTPNEIADWLIDLERFYREDGASRVTDDIKRVTGGDPRRFGDFARDYASVLQPV
ncbi:MAG: SDR family oxidoreductase [Nitrospira sp.]|nr:SDR family oxidoreductase [Nitrospira sp.]